MFIKNGLGRTAALVALSWLAGCVAVNAEENQAGLTLSPMFGAYIGDDDKDLDQGTFMSIGIGYDYGKRWASEFSYLYAEADSDGMDGEVDVRAFRFDALYHFSDTRVRPYLVFGLATGEVDTPAGETDDDSFANAGFGLKYAINPQVALRGDVRGMHGFDSSDNDVLVGLGAVFKFGTSSKPKVVSTPAAKPTMTPTPTAQQPASVVKDSDNDGVPDERDACPGSEAGAKVDEQGCYLTLEEDVSVSLNVNFATNSADVINDSVDDIKEVAEFLRSYPETTVVIEGHTDSSGAAAYNKVLSQRRAEAVVKILVEQLGVANSRVTAVGYGQERPLVANDTAANKAKNRRVTAVVRATVQKIAK